MNRTEEAIPTLGRRRADARRRMRASDADREEAAGRLGEALGEGRLDVEEYQQRLDAAYAARTHGDLDILVADLPQTVISTPARAKRRRRWLCCGW